MQARTQTVVYRRCCGIDVHKDTVVVHVMAPDGTQGQSVRKSFGTMQSSLIGLRTWLKQLKVTHIAMESTGVYWMPVWNVLEDPAFTLLLANPQQLKAAAGTQERIIPAPGATPSESPSFCRISGWMAASFPRPRFGSCEF